MYKNILISGILIISLLSLSGCVEEDQQIHIKNVDLSTVALTLDQFNETFEEYDTDHITEPYIVQEGLVFSGWKILEKYESRFSTDDVTFIIQQIARHSSEENASRFIDELHARDIGYDFSKFNSDEIGNASYIAVSNTTILGSTQTLYLISFHIDSVAVVLVSSNITYENILDLARMIEDNLSNYL